MLKSYELLYIVHPDLEGTIEKVMDKVTDFINKTDGKVQSQEDWGKRKLAYPISKNDFGVYVLVNFETDSTRLHDVERNLGLSEEIMRSIVVALPEEKEDKRPARKPIKETKVEEKVVKEVKEEIVNKIDDEITEKPAKKEPKEEKAKKETPVKSPVVKDRIEVAKKAVKKIEKPKKEVKPEDEKARLKKLDEKLEELLK